MTNFFRDDKEIFLRSWWFAHKVTHATVEKFSLTAISSWIEDEHFRGEDQKYLLEIIGYTVSFALDKLSNEIEKSHGETNEAYELNIGYQVSIGMAFDVVFGFRAKNENVFHDLFTDYYSQEYDNGYDDFWGITYDDDEYDDDYDDDDDFQINSWEEFYETLEEDKKEEERLKGEEEREYEEKYNVEKYHAYRMSKVFNVVDPQKVIDNAKQMYSGVALSFYPDAFFGLGLRRIERELKRRRTPRNPTD